MKTHAFAWEIVLLESAFELRFASFAVLFPGVSFVRWYQLQWIVCVVDGTNFPSVLTEVRG